MTKYIDAEELKEAAEKYELSIGSQDYCYPDIEDAFKAGAKWGAEQFAKVVRANLSEIGKNAQSL